MKKSEKIKHGGQNFARFDTKLRFSDFSFINFDVFLILFFHFMDLQYLLCTRNSSTGYRTEGIAEGKSTSGVI